MPEAHSGTYRCRTGLRCLSCWSDLASSHTLWLRCQPGRIAWKNSGMGRKRWAWVLSLFVAAAGCTGGSHPVARSVPATSRVTPVAATVAPALFRPTGAWFIDEAQGWVIGNGWPGGGVCVSHTRDGGRRWEAAGALPTSGRTFGDADFDYVSDV